MDSTPKKLSRTGTVILDQQSVPILSSPSAVLTKYPSRLIKSSSVFSQKRDEQVEEIKSNEWIDTFLTKDILFFIFTMLHRNDLAHASMVCKRWRAIAKDPFFGWVHIIAFEVRIQKSEEDRNNNIEKDFADPVDLKRRKTKITTQWGYTYDTEAYFMIDKNGEEISQCDHSVKHIPGRHGGYCSFDEVFCQQKPKLWRASWERIQQEDAYYYKTRFEVEIEVNVKEFEDTVHRKETVVGADIIIRQIENENLQVSNARLKTVTENKGENIPTKSLIPQKQPPGLRDGLNLYKYQLDAVAWMKSIEDNVDNDFEFKYCTLVPWRSAKTDILLDVKNHKFVTFDAIPDHVQSFNPKGAVLADEMGLGKTIECLILANPVGGEEEEEEEEEEEVDEMEVEGKKKKKNNKNNNSKKSKTVRRVRGTRKVAGQKKKPSNVDVSEEQKEFEKELYDSTATLVLCPNHLAQQWESEIVKNSNPPLKVHRFTTIRELGSCSYDDVANADVIIVSFQLLKNPNYFRIGHGETGAPRRGEQVDRYGWVRSQLKKVRKGAKSAPIMEHFRWHRMVIDEGHEIVTDPFYTDTLALYTASHFWYVTGTPFPNSNTIQGILSYLEFPEHSNHQLWPLTDILISNMYWRNTRASVKEEYKIPPVVEELVVLDFTDIERTLYDEYAYHNNLHSQRQLCSQIPKIGLTPTLDGVREASILNHKREVTNYTRTLKKARKELANFKTRLDSYRHNRLNLNAADKAQLERDIERWEGNIKDYEERIQHSTEYHKKFKQTIVFAERFLKTCKVLGLKAPARIQELSNQRKKQLEDAEKRLSEEDKKYRKEHPEEFSSDEEDKTDDNDNTNKDNTNNNNMQATSTDATTATDKPADESTDKPAQEEEKADDKPVLSEAQILKLTVPQLKAELTARGLKPKGIKADLQAQLRLHFAGKTPTEKEDQKEEEEAEEEPEEKPKKPTKRTLRNRKEVTEDKPVKGKAAKQKPKKRRKKDYDSSSESEDEAEFSDEDKKSYDLNKKRSNIELLEELLDLIENYGSKMGNLIYYLRRLWEKTPESRVIIFSQFNSVLWEVSDILAKNDIESSFVQGNVMRRNKAINSFKAKDSEVRVIMLGLEKAASGTNLVEASHVVLMDPVTGTKQEAQSIEAQAIARAHRQGQTNQVTLVRFVIQDTVEHSMYVQNYLDDDESQFRGKQKDLGAIHKAIAEVNRPPTLKRAPSGIRPRMLKGASIGNLLANSPLKSSGSVIQLIENSTDVVVGELAELPAEENKEDKQDKQDNKEDIQENIKQEASDANDQPMEQ